MNLQNNNISLKMDISNLPKKQNVSLNEQVITYGGKVDYEKNVVNKPTLNGKELVGDITEEDPSMVAISLSDLSSMLDGILK